MKLQLRSVGKTFHSRTGDRCALKDVSFEVDSGELLCLVGPSGCGKTTVLNLIAGLERPDQGEVLIDGHAIEGPGQDRVLIFQEAALFPWLNVRDNVAFGLAVGGVPRGERAALATRFLQLVHLDGFEKAYVHELSGGMKQRVALARSLALDPQVLLMDEPFAALDAQTREMLHQELQSLWAQTGKTIVFVTHNVREALVLGDRVLVMSARPGHIKSELACALPRPRHTEDHALVDLAQRVLTDLRDEVLAAQKEAERERLAS